MVGQHLGPYVVVAKLGEGGMGEVYRARDTRLDRFVAIKVLSPDVVSPHALERFEREAKVIAALNHPRICTVYDVGTSPVPFLVMELLDGETLHQRLARGAVDVPTLVDLGLALADALAAAHLKGIAHRDLKPGNIFLTVHGPKILDFGLARIAEPAGLPGPGDSLQPTLATQGPITDVGVAVGTVAYMSPEQLRGDRLDVRTDLFSLGVVLYEMATGRRPFTSTSGAATTAAILRDEPPTPRQFRPDLPARLEQAILTLLEKDRDVRTQTASELRAELTRIKREMSGARPADAPSTPAPSALAAAVVPSQPSSGTPAPPSSDAQLVAGLLGRHRVAAVTAAVVLVLAVAGVGYVASRPVVPASGADRSLPSISDLQVQQLTTSGTAATPVISPDGRYVAYVEQGTPGSSLRVRQIATGSTVEILPGEPGVQIIAPAVTPDGTFVNYLKRVPQQPLELWQVPFLGGSPRRLLTGIGSGVGFSPDGRQMAFLRGADVGATEVVIAAPDGSDARVLATRRPPQNAFMTLGEAGGLGWFAPAWSPDGTTLAVFGLKALPTGQIVFLDTQTGAERAAVDVGSPIAGISLAWLDEGTLVLSMLERSSAPLQLWLLSYPEGVFTRLTNDVSQYVGLTITADRNELVTSRSDAEFSIWTSDVGSTRWTETVPKTPNKGPIGFGVRWIGDDLVYTSSASGVWGIERWRASTSTRELLVSRAGAPEVSRDGSTVAFFDYDSGELWRMDADGRNKVLVSRGNPGARITPDGREVVAVSAAPGRPVAVTLQTIGAAGQVREITADRVRPGGALVSPDGQWVAYSAFDDQNQPAVAICSLPACSSKQMVPVQATATGFSWTPDSHGVAYVDPRTRAAIWVQPREGGPPRQLAHVPGEGLPITDFAWSADGRRLAVARGVIPSNIVLFRGLKTPR